jgi:hypothetical protein
MFRSLPAFGGDQRAVAEVVRGIMDGKTNNTGSITLTQSSTTTTLTDRRIGPDSVILFSPLNARGAEEIGQGGLYISSRGQGTATITHGSHNYDMKYAYAIIG